MLCCTKCNSPLPKQVINSKSLESCPSCVGLLRADVFPAFYKSLPTGQLGETLQMDKDAGCFYHSSKKAVFSCSVCGRFVCALCDVPLNGRHLCPACFEKGKTKGKIKNLENQRTCYDSIALLVATVPLLIIFFPWFTIFTAPLAMYLTIRHWKTPSSIIPRTKIRFILAAAIASVQIAGWVFFITHLVRSS